MGYYGLGFVLLDFKKKKRSIKITAISCYAILKFYLF